jgi:TRAP-type C4-dicarboxylate transport system permease large subunit
VDACLGSQTRRHGDIDIVIEEHPLYLGIVLIANIGVGLFLPPVGLGVIVASAIGRSR